MTNIATTVSIDELRERTNRYLRHRLSDLHDVPSRLAQAIQYVVNAGGKRLRPTLVYYSGLSFGAKLEDLDPVAAAVELIHTYSLVHDDLPAMDDDDLRRGNPTCHIQYDEATAILVGDALQCLAFELLAESNTSPLTATTRLQLIHTLCRASGAQGMAGGQMLDLLATGQAADLQSLEQIHRLKTGELIKACILMGGMCANADQTALHALDQFAQHIGLAYQIHDDIIDIESTTEQLGKTQGADQQLNKATYPSLVGLSQAKQLRDQQFQAGIDALNQLDTDTSLLLNLAETIITRDH